MSLPLLLPAFEAEVFDCLSSAGLTLIPQMGASQFRIDMVAEHPTQPGRYVLAIECDGATYHSSYTARDRDRLRQQQLENLGWRFHRIWSTDWFLRKESEIQRATKAFEEAVEYKLKTDVLVDQPQQVSFRNLVFQPEIVEQRFRAVVLPHHDQQASNDRNPAKHESF